MSLGTLPPDITPCPLSDMCPCETLSSWNPSIPLADGRDLTYGHQHTVELGFYFVSYSIIYSAFSNLNGRKKINNTNACAKYFLFFKTVNPVKQKKEEILTRVIFIFQFNFFCSSAGTGHGTLLFCGW